MNLSHNDFDRLHKFYAGALKRHGLHDAESVRWSDRENQLMRFEILLQVGDISGASVLDVGCGLGDLFGFINDKGISIDYTGIDIVPEFIEAAQKKFHRSLFPNAKFMVQDIFEVTNCYDFVFASGALTFKVEDNDEHYKRMIEKMFSLCRTALAFNMLNSSTHIDNKTYATYSPKEISTFCRTISDSVEVMTDYYPEDFTVFCHKMEE